MASYFPVNLMLTVAFNTETISCIRNAHKKGENINPQKALATCINRRACDYVINQVRIHREASLTVGDCWWDRCHRVIFDHHRNCEIGDHTIILVTTQSSLLQQQSDSICLGPVGFIAKVEKMHALLMPLQLLL